MEFGSKYVYTYLDSSEEEVSEEEFSNVYNNCFPEISHDLDSSSRRKPPKPLKSRGARDDDRERCTLSESKELEPVPKIHKWMQMLPSKQSSSKSPAESSSVPPPSAPPLKPRGSKVKKWRRADTNVVAIKFDQLTSPSNMHTGDPVTCTDCQAMLSHISKITKDGENQVWVCEYCGTSNPVDLVSEEIPAEADVTYMLEPAPATTASGRSGKDESLVVFCVDVSGSMCVSQEVPGTMRLKGNHSDRFHSLNTDGENQWLHGQRRDVTYVTRLQGLQAAVDSQLQELATDHPNRRVALVTFNSEVTVVGDGSGIPLTIAGEKLNSEDELMRIGSEVMLPTSIANSRDTLGKQIFDLEEGGQTALGPALLVSTVIACQVPGSKVIICTDGMANIGVGNLDNLVTTEDFEVATVFYQKVSTIAKSKGVSVSILTIAGTECKLVELGRVASQTGGQVNTVDPLKLTQEFGNILADPVIATRVVATFLVHKGLYIRNDTSKSSRAVKEVGNVSKGSEITFEYGVRRTSSKSSASTNAAGNSEAAAAGSSSASGSELKQDQLNELPFQVHISYIDLEGAKAVRVLTQTKPITKERKQAEMYMNMPILSAHAIQKSSVMAVEGDYTPSRLNAYMYQRLFYRNVSDPKMMNQYNVYNKRSASLADKLLHEQKIEARSSGLELCDLDDEESGMHTEDTVDAGKTKATGSKMVKLFKNSATARAKRRMNCPDAVAQDAYVNAASSSRAMEDDSDD